MTIPQTECINLYSLRKKMLSQIELLGQSNKTACTFLKEKLKILPIKQQLKWCDIF